MPDPVPPPSLPGVPLRQPRRGHGRATLADVAAAAGVTAITVSRYLREPHRVAPDTAAAVAAALLRHRLPAQQAGRRAGQRGQRLGTRMVAALIPSIANSIFAETVQGLADALQGSGCELLLAATGYSAEREEEQLRALLGWFPSALVVTGRRHTPGALALLHQAQARGTPVIEIWDHHPEPGAEGFTQIGFDHEQVGRAMAEHLIARGYRSLAYVDSGVAEDFRAHERGDGFLAAARRRRVPARRIAAPAREAIEAGRLRFASLLDERRPAPACAPPPSPTITWPAVRCSKRARAAWRCRRTWRCWASATSASAANSTRRCPPCTRRASRSARPPRARCCRRCKAASSAADERLPWTLIPRGTS